MKFKIILSLLMVLMIMFVNTVSALDIGERTALNEQVIKTEYEGFFKNYGDRISLVTYEDGTQEYVLIKSSLDNAFSFVDSQTDSSITVNENEDIRVVYKVIQDNELLFPSTQVKIQGFDANVYPANIRFSSSTYDISLGDNINIRLNTRVQLDVGTYNWELREYTYLFFTATDSHWVLTDTSPLTINVVSTSASTVTPTTTPTVSSTKEVFITSSPSGATVKYNGIVQGTTTISMVFSQGENKILTFEKSGYETESIGIGYDSPSSVDVPLSLINIVPTSTPTATPTATPTSTPTATPTATPTETVTVNGEDEEGTNEEDEENILKCEDGTIVSNLNECENGEDEKSEGITNEQIVLGVIILIAVLLITKGKGKK